MAKDGVGRRGVLAAAGASGLLAGAPATVAAKPGGSSGASRLTTPPEAIIETKLGKLRGAVRDGVYSFKGAPYGRSTGGASRFLPPEAAASWTGVKTALAYGPCCPQVARAGWRNDEVAFIYDWDDGFPGEDCLRLNVWSAGLAGQGRPVMVWIHGGGYEAGSSQELPSYDGERLARRGDLVVVSVNHRLGPFGFLDLSGVGGERYGRAGNAGMLDLVMALEWVRDNIAAFGGDPRNVTIFGQSGGGGKVSALMAMPAAKGLFHKAIVQSGSQLGVASPERSRRIAAEVMRALGVTDVAKLAEVPAAALVEAGEAAKKALPKSPPGTPIWDSMVWQPVVDGAVIPAQTWTPAAPALSAGIPMLIGATLNEYSPSLGNAGMEAMTEPMAKGILATTLGAGADAAWTAWRSAYPDAAVVDLVSRIVSGQFGAPAVAQAQRKARQGDRAWLYRFDYNPPVLDGRARAFHCSELAYVFDNVDRCLNSTGGTEEARALAAKMADAWIAFARSGDPNHKGLPKWPVVGGGAASRMLFDAKCAVAAVNPALGA
jgi:para-nitrobenzyl esterase